MNDQWLVVGQQVRKACEAFASRIFVFFASFAVNELILGLKISASQPWSGGLSCAPALFKSRLEEICSKFLYADFLRGRLSLVLCAPQIRGYSPCCYPTTLRIVSWSALAEAWRPLSSLGQSSTSMCWTTPRRPTTVGTLIETLRSP